MTDRSPVNVGAILDAISRIRMETFRLELWTAGHHIVGSRADELRDAARRLENLTKLMKDRAPAEVEKVRDAA